MEDSIIRNDEVVGSIPTSSTKSFQAVTAKTTAYTLAPHVSLKQLGRRAYGPEMTREPLRGNGVPQGW